MRYLTKEITKDVYDRAMANHRMITEEDRLAVFSRCEIFGYGIYSTKVHTDGNTYYCDYSRGETCE